MCGRFVTGADELTWAEYREMLTLSTHVDFLEERVCYPGSKVSVICEDPGESAPGDQGIYRKDSGAAEGEDCSCVEKETGGRKYNRRILCEMTWGLKPSPGQRERGVGLIFNLRDDRIAKTYPQLFRHRRCLFPASGFFEWKKLPSGKKQGFRISLADDALFSFAGLWRNGKVGGGELPGCGSLGLTECREGVVEEGVVVGKGNGGRVQSSGECSLMTTSPNDQMAPIHQRMPVILLGEAANYWLSSGSDPKNLQKLLRPCNEELIIRPMESPGGVSQLSLF